MLGEYVLDPGHLVDDVGTPHPETALRVDSPHPCTHRGKLREGAKGVDPNQYLPAAKLGVCKVNIDTDGRLVWTRVHREFFEAKPEEFDLRPAGKVFMAEYAKFIASRNELLGSAGQLDSVREFVTKK